MPVLEGNRQDACEAKSKFSCGTGILPVLENGATYELELAVVRSGKVKVLNPSSKAVAGNASSEAIFMIVTIANPKMLTAKLNSQNITCHTADGLQFCNLVQSMMTV
ncbi:hypothetical protein [Oscillatoria nigro-viridis]|uniref:hypothetical protein n=1 Tax=Phormidium nigroviride TaxID=482564 RepID=UPI00031387A9|nr:hypothetical protein [Oscillatoria nigro-viridis]